MKRRSSAALLAGWLFADTLLGITFIALGSEPELPPVAAAAKPIPPPVPPPSTPAPRPPTPVGVEQRPVEVRLPPGPSSTAQIRQLLHAQLVTRRRAAFVLTFGIAARPGPGIQQAKAANAALLAAAPELFGGSAQRDFWQALNPANPVPGSIRVELYLFTTSTPGAPS